MAEPAVEPAPSARDGEVPLDRRRRGQLRQRRRRGRPDRDDLAARRPGATAARSAARSRCDSWVPGPSAARAASCWRVGPNGFCRATSIRPRRPTVCDSRKADPDSAARRILMPTSTRVWSCRARESSRRSPRWSDSGRTASSTSGGSGSGSGTSRTVRACAPVGDAVTFGDATPFAAFRHAPPAGTDRARAVSRASSSPGCAESGRRRWTSRTSRATRAA